MMHARLAGWFIAALVSVSPAALSQQACPNGIHVVGVISDPTGAVIPGARVGAADGSTATSDARGSYILPCIPGTSVTLNIKASGFADGIARAHGKLSSVAQVNVTLAIESIEEDVQVSGDSGIESSGDTVTLSTAAVQSLADDPDDFLRELQVLAAEAGGDPTAATVIVDGFQNPSAVPPKSSIASIRINPDLFSAKYRYPPFFGGVIEVTTKPGADKFHGALFFTDSDGSFNATDPFSAIATPAGRRRYGFEFSGPIVSQKSGFSLALEKRDIDEFNVVNAVTLDSNNGLGPSGNGVQSQQTVSAPQRFWIGSARGDWQVTPNNVAGLSFSAHVNNEGNQGVGGLTLANAGYSSLISEYDLRIHNTETITPNIVNETRIGYTWLRTEDTAASNAPSVDVAGFFLGGGATSQNLNNRERNLEIDDEVTAVHGIQTLAFGAQSYGIFVHDYDPNTFNGAYVFGGGSAPALDTNNNPTGETTTITALEQYRRALLDLPGGSPTTYQVTTGTPLVPLTQWQMNLYVQDTVKLTQRLSLDAGLRYSLQTSPGSFSNFNPRIGLAWSPDKKQRWVFHGRAGIFSTQIAQTDATDVYRLNGLLQRQTTVYSPSYNAPLATAAGSVQIATMNLFSPTISQPKTFNCFFNIEHELAHQWHASGNYFCGGAYGLLRTVNINAPLVASSVGVAPDPTAALLAPRPIAPNENLIEYQNSGHVSGNAAWFTLSQHSNKWFGLSARYLWRNMKSDAYNNRIPQSSYSKEGESGRVSGWYKNSVTFSGNLNLPYKLQAAAIFDFSNGVPYNVTTGTDNNGDGNFTDRPSFASAPGPGVYSTPFGLLTTNTVNGNVPVNLGTMPALIHLDMNMSRVFTLDSKDKDQHRTLAFNVRSANLLNHTNVTAVNTILSSGELGQPVAAEAARRIELGVRFAF